MSSLFSVIRSAVRSGAADDVLEQIEGEAGAQALNPETPLAEATTEGGHMSGIQSPAGAANAATATIAAVAAASGGADGFKTAMDRMNAILGADGIKGDAKRMSAALDLANASPDMSADAVVAFVTANVASANAETPEPAASQASQPVSAAAYEHQRVAAANLAMPGGQSSSAKTDPGSSWSASIAKVNARVKGA